MPRYVDHDERRRAIVDAAWLLIADEGYEAVTIRRLARELGGATGRITHYFDAKDDILVAVLDELTAAHRSGLVQLQGALDLAGSDVAALTAAIIESLPLDDDRIRDWKTWLAFWTRASLSPVIAERHKDVYAAWRLCLSNALAAAVESKPSQRELDRSAEQLLAFIDGLGVHLLIEPDRVDADSLFELVQTQIVDALARLQNG